MSPRFFASPGDVCGLGGPAAGPGHQLFDRGKPGSEQVAGSTIAKVPKEHGITPAPGRLSSWRIFKSHGAVITAAVTTGSTITATSRGVRMRRRVVPLKLLPLLVSPIGDSHACRSPLKGTARLC